MFGFAIVVFRKTIQLVVLKYLKQDGMTVVGGVVAPCDYDFVCCFAGLCDVVVVACAYYVGSGCEGFRVG